MSQAVAGPGADAAAPMPWTRIGALLAGALLLLFAFGQLMDAGARVSGEHVQRFDAGLLVAADGSETGPQAVRVRGNCHSRGDCERRFRIKFRNDAPTHEGLYALYVPQ
jgi:hypothetical protein